MNSQYIYFHVGDRSTCIGIIIPPAFAGTGDIMVLFSNHPTDGVCCTVNVVCRPIPDQGCKPWKRKTLQCHDVTVHYFNMGLIMILQHRFTQFHSKIFLLNFKCWRNARWLFILSINAMWPSNAMWQNRYGSALTLEAGIQGLYEKLYPAVSCDT